MQYKRIVSTRATEGCDSRAVGKVASTARAQREAEWGALAASACCKQRACAHKLRNFLVGPPLGIADAGQMQVCPSALLAGPAGRTTEARHVALGGFTCGSLATALRLTLLRSVANLQRLVLCATCCMAA